MLKGIKFKEKIRNKYYYEFIDYALSNEVIEEFLSKIKGSKISGIENQVGLKIY